MTSTGYLAIIEKTPDSIYGVVFPDVPGCYSAGGALSEARAMAHEALTLHLEELDDFPPRRPLKTIISDPEFADILENAVEIVEIPLLIAEAAE